MHERSRRQRYIREVPGWKLAGFATLAPLLWIGGPVTGASAQSLLERSPNLGGTWIGTPGTMEFHFMHRFEASPPPTRKVVNTPTFLLSVPLGMGGMLGARYATNSVLVTGYPNEWEFFGRYAPLLEADGAPLDLAIHAAYNQAAASWDGELALARQFDPVRIQGAVRGFSAFQRADSRWAVAGGATLRLHEFIAVAGDVATLLDPDPDEVIAWSAGLHLRLPTTPHTLSFHAANTHTTTLQGGSLGTIDGRRWGFEFTIPFTFSRIFGSRAGPTASEAAAAPIGQPGDTATVTMTNQLAFQPAAIRIRVGETVRWTNTSDLPHTVTADPQLAANARNVTLPDGAETFHSGDMAPGDVFSHTFTVAGEYSYVCLPHEAAGMIGRVMVEP